MILSDHIPDFMEPCSAAELASYDSEGLAIAWWMDSEMDPLSETPRVMSLGAEIMRRGLTRGEISAACPFVDKDDPRVQHDPAYLAEPFIPLTPDALQSDARSSPSKGSTWQA